MKLIKKKNERNKNLFFETRDTYHSYVYIFFFWSTLLVE